MTTEIKDSIVEFNHVVFKYPNEGFVLDVPSLTIPKGSKTALIGSSGCGKTTLANLMGGIHLPQQGTITIDRKQISEMNEAKRRDFRISNIGFIFQEFELLDHLRLEENVMLPYYINASMRLNADVRERARQLCHSVGLGNKLKRFPGQLSQGEKQRLAICRALLTEPSLIIADEPTGNLDEENTQAIMDLITHQVERLGLTLVMITHDRSLLERFDKVIDLTSRQSKEES